MISGDLLREARLRAGLSQAELARRASKPTSVIGRWERNEVKPSLETVREIIRAAGFELAFQLSNAGEDDHDLAQIRRSLARTPAERFAYGQRAARQIAEVWRDATHQRWLSLTSQSCYAFSIVMGSTTSSSARRLQSSTECPWSPTTST